MVTGLSACLAYMACASFYQAGERRSQVALLKASPAVRRGVYAGAWILLLVALWLLATPQGWERGVPIWLGVLTGAGALSLFIAALRPTWHVASIAVAGVGALAFLLGALFA